MSSLLWPIRPRDCRFRSGAAAKTSDISGGIDAYGMPGQRSVLGNAADKRMHGESLLSIRARVH